MRRLPAISIRVGTALEGTGRHVWSLRPDADSAPPRATSRAEKGNLVSQSPVFWASAHQPKLPIEVHFQQHVGATRAGEPCRHGKLSLLPQPEYFHFELEIHLGLQPLVEPVSGAGNRPQGGIEIGR